LSGFCQGLTVDILDTFYVKLYRDFFVNISAGWFFAVFAAIAANNIWQIIAAFVLCISCILLADELDRLDEE
jgi:hypothetical protein